MPETSVVTLSRHILEEERRHPEASGQFTSVLLEVALAAKIISREVNKAGLVDDIMGSTGEENLHGERVQKLDAYADEVIYKALDHTGTLCCMGSEEHEGLLPIPDRFPKGEYVLLFDPLDGSSNIDVNVSIGTIFSIHRRVSGPEGSDGLLEDCLQPGKNQVAAGYVVYGSSTILVYTSGNGVHGFTLDPSIGEFLLSHPDIRMPDGVGNIYSVNESYYRRWSPGQQRFVSELKTSDPPFTSRYIGSMVADVHRTLLKGGIFMYPPEVRKPGGKLRLLYEAAPMAFLVEQAGGKATDGRRDLLEIEPTSLHQRTPLYVGSRELVDRAAEYLAQDDL
ncbi:MAG: class 1 fructose-bisphosphatase [Gemmatimonadales bacterium]|jgi:fructose-1,6-bisphosphatase I|nr:MAG: class 1 fructose-bisphosphatase [Gemmatimonadales bacterium]